MLELISPADRNGSHDPSGHANPASPVCLIHPGSLVRRYRTHGPSGPGVYPQCVPADGEQPHLLAWTDVQAAPAPRADTSGLSLSERGVLIDAANGMTVIETAASRSKSPETVKTQRRSILLKLGARNMAQAVGMMQNDT
jgi:DNA-binding CsgD family transcriptional regulator